MNLLYITLNISNERYGAGGWIRTVNILREFSKKKINFDILTTQNGKSLLCKEGLSNESFIILENNFFSEKKNNTRLSILCNWIIYLIIFIKKWRSLDFKKYTKIYSDSDFFIDIIPNWIISQNQKCANFCIIHHCVNLNKFQLNSIVYNLVSYFLQRLSFIIIKNFKGIFVYENYEGKEIRKLFIKKFKFKGKFGFVHNGLNIKFLKSLQNKNIKKNKNSILFYGAIRRNKGLHDIFSIFKNLIKINSEIKLTIAGGMGKDTATIIQKFIRNIKIKKKIKVLGHLSEKQKFNAILSSQAIIFPSYEEGWGIGIMESRFLNRNVLCYDIKSLKSLHKNKIYFTKTGDTKKFATRLSKLLKKKNQSLDNSYLNKYDWSKCAKKDLDLFKRM
jgi:glycosyltransferase involved in cell wall biosynthesis